MKHILLFISFIFIIALPVSAMPGFNPNDNEPIVYDTSYNIALHKKLVSDYDKKYLKCNKSNTICNYDLSNYEQEVTLPYYRNAKSYKDTIIKQ